MSNWQFHTLIRHGSASFFRGGLARFRKLGTQQPLLLIPEPGNPVQSTAVRVADLMGQPVGYLAAEDAPIVFERIVVGRESLLARTDGEPSRRDGCPVFIWSEGLDEEVSLAAKTRRPVEA